MPLDLDKFPPATKTRQIELGRRFSSQDTLAQANQTLAAYDKYGALLEPYGFIRADATMLMDARELLRLAGVDRDAAKGQKKTQSTDFAKALHHAQGARLRARSVLETGREELEAAGADAAESRVSAALTQTSAASDQAEKMASQLDILAKVLRDTDVAAAVRERGGPAALTALDQAATALRAADDDNTKRRGTPAETQTLDQADGIIVIYARRARRAARAAARDQGNPALARAFKLDKLYRSRSNGSGEDEDDDDLPDDV